MFYSSHFSDVFLQPIFNRITTHDNSNVQYHHKEENKSNSTITANSGAHALTRDQIIKSPYNKNNAATIKISKIPAKILLLGLLEWVQ